MSAVARSTKTANERQARSTLSDEVQPAADDRQKKAALRGATFYFPSQPFRTCFWLARFSCFAARFSFTLRPGFFASPVGLDLTAIGDAPDSKNP